MDYKMVTDKEVRSNIKETHFGGIHWMFDKESGTANDCCFALVTYRPGESHRRHKHPYEELVYVLKGRIKHTAGDEAVEMGPGDSIYIPPGMFHHQVCLSDDGAEILVVYVSGDKKSEYEDEAE